MGASGAFDYRSGSFVDFVKEHTNGKGVDLILDCVGASYWQQNVEAVKVDGRWVLYGTMGGVNVDGPLLGAVLRKRINLVGTTLRARDDDYKVPYVKKITMCVYVSMFVKIKEKKRKTFKRKDQ